MPRPLTLTIDLGVQEVVRSELAAAVARFKAKGGTGIVLDVATGEIVGMVSLPDFDPNRYQQASVAQRFNRNSQGATSWARCSRCSPWRWRSMPAWST